MRQLRFLIDADIAVRCIPFRSAWPHRCIPLDALEAHLRDTCARCLAHFRGPRRFKLASTASARLAAPPPQLLPQPGARRDEAALAMAHVAVFLGPMWSGKTSRLISAIVAQRPRFARVRVIKHAIDTRAPAALLVARTGLQQQADLCVADLRDVPVSAADPPTLFAVDEAQFFGDGLLDLFERVAACGGGGGGGSGGGGGASGPGGGSPTKAADAGAAAAAAAVAAAATLPKHGLLVAGLDLDFKGETFGCVLELAQRALAAAASKGGCGGAAAGLGEVLVERLTARCDHRGAARGAPVCGRAAPFSQRLLAGGGATVVVGGDEFYAPACAEHHRASPGDASEWGRG